MTTKQPPEQFMLRVEKGMLVPADGYTQRRLREKGYRIGDTLAARLTKPRNPGFHRLSHAFGRLVAENIDDFSGMDAHAVLKRLQWEAGIGCEEMGAKVPGAGFVVIRIPQSLSFASMDDGAFREIFRGLARHVAQNYWHDLTPEQIEQMADTMPGEE